MRLADKICIVTGAAQGIGAATAAKFAAEGATVIPCDRHAPRDGYAVDVTDRPDVVVGDEVELWGRNIAVTDVATRAGTISYELLTGVSARVPRIYEVK